MKTSRKGMLMAALICGTIVPVLFGGSSAYAAEKDAVDEALSSFELNPMVVTAQRTETKDLDTPATTKVITKEDLEKTGATTVMDAIRRVPGITDSSYAANGDDMGSSPSRIFIRGFDKGTLLLVNGAPINFNNYASPNSIPVNAIEKIEIIKGANSVLYGPEAMAGVVNIITKKGEGTVKTTISGAAGNKLKKYNLSIQGDGVIMSFGRDYVHEFERADAERKIIRDGKKYRSIKNYQRTNAFGSFAISPSLQFTWTYQRLNPLYGTRNLSDGKYTGKRYAYDDTKNAGSLIYTDKEHQIKSTLAYSSKRVISNQYNADGSWNKPTDSGSNYTISTIYFDTQKKWDFGKADSLIFGISGKHEAYKQRFKDPSFFDLDNERNSYAAYLSYNKQFNDKFSTTLGLRGETFRKSDADDNNYNELLPQIQALYKINDKTSWYVNVAKAFEMPAMNSHTSAGGDVGQIKYRNNIKPEEGWNYETGFKRITDSSSTKLAVFYMDYKNKFKWVEVTPGVSKPKKQVNLGKFKNTGIELEYEKKLSNKWDYNFGITYQDPKSRENDAWTQESARLQFNAGINYKLNKFSSNLNCSVLKDREDSYYAYNGVKPRLKDRVQLNASFMYRPTDNQSVALNLYNILDREDEISTYEYRDLPFNWLLTYNYTF